MYQREEARHPGCDCRTRRWNIISKAGLSLPVLCKDRPIDKVRAKQILISLSPLSNNRSTLANMLMKMIGTRVCLSVGFKSEVQLIKEISTDVNLQAPSIRYSL